MGDRVVDFRRSTEESGAGHPWMAAAATMGFALTAAFLAIACIAYSNARDPATTFAWFKTTPPPVEPVAVVEEAAPPEPEIRQVEVERGDTLTEILVDAGVEASEARAAVGALGDVFDPSDLRAGQTVTLTFAPASTQLMSVAFKPSVERDVAVVRGADGAFAAEENVKQLTARDTRAGGVIDGSLYLSAKAKGVPEAVIVDLIRIFSHDVDFQREVRSGDRFDILYTNYVDETGEAIKGGAIAFAELTLRGEKKPLYRFTTSDDQTTDYFTPKGWSGKRLLMRTPVDGARLTSGFGARRHPILGYTKMHKGVDFGAPTGTPVMAAGHGVIEKAEWYGGYGRYVRVRHANSYSTAYAHLSRFARGIRPGVRVRQGQLVGYVGSTGRSTGPHLHYEVMVRAKQINPMGVKLPTGRNLTGRDMAAFQAEIARVQQVLAQIPAEPSLVAQGGPLQASEPSAP
ncbi:MAG: peptidoglycan DD-metalloendopeptidase family protein [Alphaproteobacteria bacterium]|nr:peptidoglycan DD-metalloendopeptidase family protein [Alphaproteobacteria bacterium]